MRFHYSLDLCFWDSRFVVCERGLGQAASNVGGILTPCLSPSPHASQFPLEILSVKVLSLHGQEW